ncbi:Soluble lytic murein transglycosylase precursor [compost metagenome]
MRFLRKKRVFALLLLVFLLILFLNSALIGKKLYPIYYQKEIRQSATNLHIDPFLIAAVIRVETNYQELAESRKGAIGIMQLMPDTAAWIIETADLPFDDVKDIWKTDVNITLGSWYLQWLIKHYDGNLFYAIAAYNAGQGNVNKWKQNQVWNGTVEDIKQIPFGETRHYVHKVLYYYNKYKSIHAEDWTT